LLNSCLRNGGQNDLGEPDPSLLPAETPLVESSVIAPMRPHGKVAVGDAAMTGREKILAAFIVDTVQGRCVVFGNVDAIGVLQDGPADLVRAEVDRQMKAGRNNGNRFVLSTGSPITPATPVERVRLFTDVARESQG
jgi:hypothetical protein